jgi:adenylate cyclase
MLALTIFISFTLANVISRPIVALTQVAEEVRNGNLSVNIQVKSNDEIGQLGITFNLMIKNINNSIEEIKLQKDAFYRFVPENFLNLLEKKSATDIHLGDKIIDNLTILFSDIRSFTTLSESISPDEVYAFLNEYFQLITPLISNGGGFIDKYMGDGIMAIFADNSKNKQSADNSIHTAISLIRELGNYNKLRVANGKEAIRIGIGINTGELIIGTVGTKDRLSTTVVGNTVNLASRLESITSKYSTEIIVSATTIANLRDHSVIRYREIDTIIAKGMSSPCEIYEVYNHKDLEFQQKMSYSLKPYMDGLVAYKLGLFEEAKVNFQEASSLNPEDTISKLYLERTKLLIEQPPSRDWDGVVKFDAK